MPIKIKEDSDKVSDEDLDEVFPDKTTKGKIKKKRNRTEEETVTPVKRKQKNLQVSQPERRIYELRQNLKKTA